MTVVNGDSRVVNKLKASLTDYAIVIIYDRHMFIVQATEQFWFELVFTDHNNKINILLLLPEHSYGSTWPENKIKSTQIRCLVKNFITAHLKGNHYANALVTNLWVN